MAREVLYFAVWAAAFAGRSILWRGRRLRVLPGARVAIEHTHTPGAPLNTAPGGLDAGGQRP